MSRLVCALVPLLALSCADSGGPVFVDAQWNLTCPSEGTVGCGSLAPQTCLGNVGQRAIVGEHREMACTGDPIIATCEAVERPDGTRTVTLKADVGGKFAFQLRSAAIDGGDGLVQQSECNVTIIEDELPYDVGACGTEPPSMEQPCQLSNISTVGDEITFGLECDSLLSSTSDLAFDVGAVGGGPVTIRFANCTGF